MTQGGKVGRWFFNNEVILRNEEVTPVRVTDIGADSESAAVNSLLMRCRGS
jgi:hypothetical protein